MENPDYIYWRRDPHGGSATLAHSRIRLYVEIKLGQKVTNRLLLLLLLYLFSMMM